MGGVCGKKNRVEVINSQAPTLPIDVRIGRMAHRRTTTIGSDMNDVRRAIESIRHVSISTEEDTESLSPLSVISGRRSGSLRPVDEHDSN
jgi:hypothetical protein